MRQNIKSNNKAPRYVEKYTPQVIPGVKRGFALGFPNDYFCGMSNLGLQVIYKTINARGDTACERFFLEERTADTGLRPLKTIETARPVRDFPLIGLTLSFELDYFNVVKIIEQIGMPIYAAERTENQPLLIGGGPCATANPEPIADLFDIFVIGEGEDVINEILDCHYTGQDKKFSRQELLIELSGIPGVYVPTLEKQSVERQTKKNFSTLPPASSAIVAKDTEFSSMFLLEIARGCGRHCRFCMAGYCTRPPRVCDLELLKTALEQPLDDNLRVGLVGCAISDYPWADELCEHLLVNKINFSVASLRADSVSDVMLNALATSGHKTVTFAPEAGSERLRAIINKTITREHIISAVERSTSAGIPNVRLYFMIGLPFEQLEDIQGIVELSAAVVKIVKSNSPRGRLTLSVNPFIPKPHTPFQRLPYVDSVVLRERYDYLKTEIAKLPGVELKTEDLRQAAVQAMLARGDRGMAKLIVEAAKYGGFKAWKRVLKANGIGSEKLLSGFEEAEQLPWSHIDCGVNEHFFSMELAAAINQKYSASCFADCKKCGVCK
ncbi:MAG: radical SAM protein [Bacillota bacterium]